MKILGIETSCDETAVAIVEGRGERVRVIRDAVASQIRIHARYGGVVPEVAARAHVEKIDALLRGLRTADYGLRRDGKGIDAIAVTAGPGLITSLRVGVDVARTLAWAWDKPLVGVNHLEGHIYANFIGDENGKKRGGKGKEKGIRFPAVVLIVSGGHTELVLMTRHGKYRLLGATRDDAAGEAFDKVAKILGLGYPGGPAVSKLAARGNPDAIDFPRPMIGSKDFDFSFSGLKTAVLYKVRDNFPSLRAERSEAKQSRDHGIASSSRVLGTPRNDKFVRDVCASFEKAAVDVLVEKTIRAAKKYRVKTVLLAGGVSANRRLRKDLGRAVSARLSATHYSLPTLAYTTDNAAMIAAAGYFRARKRQFADPLKLEPRANWQL